MSPEPSIRLAGLEDAGEVTRLLAGFRDWMGNDRPAEDVIATTVGTLLGDPDTEFLLGVADEAAIGVCQLRFRLCVWTGAPDCWLEDLYIEQRARRRGAGAALVAAAIGRASERGCHRIDLDVNEDNAPARALYEAMGFSTEPKPPGRTLYVARRLV